LLRLDRLQPEALRGATAERRDLQPNATVVRNAQRVIVAASGAAEVRYAHDRELESLRRVDRHQPDRLEVLRFERRLALAR
jgi:hypothetical protein